MHSGPPSGGRTTGGAGRFPFDISTNREYSFVLDTYTIVVPRAGLTTFMASNVAITRHTLLEKLPIRLSRRYTEKEWWATPGDGFCGLHFHRRFLLQLTLETKQKPALPDLKTLITSTLLPRLDVDK